MTFTPPKLLLSKGERVRLRDGREGAVRLPVFEILGLKPPAVVELDGWEAEKAAEREYAREHGEGTNIVPWTVTVDLCELEIILPVEFGPIETEPNG